MREKIGAFESNAKLEEKASIEQLNSHSFEFSKQKREQIYFMVQISNPLKVVSLDVEFYKDSKNTKKNDDRPYFRSYDVFKLLKISKKETIFTSNFTNKRFNP